MQTEIRRIYTSAEEKINALQRPRVWRNINKPSNGTRFLRHFSQNPCISMGKRLNTRPYTDLLSKQERTRWILLQNGKLSYEKEHQIYVPYASSCRPESTLKRSSDDTDSNDINVSLSHGENSRRGRLKTGAVHEALKASAILKILK